MPINDDGGRAVRAATAAATKVKDASVAAAGEAAKAAGVAVNITQTAASSAARSIADLLYKVAGKK